MGKKSNRNTYKEGLIMKIRKVILANCGGSCNVFFKKLKCTKKKKR